MPDDEQVKREGADLEEAAGRGDTACLLEALGDPSFELRVAAARLLGVIGGERARIALTSVARNRGGERPEVRIAAMESLGRFHGEEAFAALLEEFVTGDNGRVVSAARRLLSEVDPEGYPFRLLSRGCLDHRAVSLYGRSRLPEAVPFLSRFIVERIEAGDILKTAFWGKVYVAVKALGNIGGEEAVKTIKLLDEWLSEPVSGAVGGLHPERSEKIRVAALEAIDAAGKGKGCRG